MNRKTVIGLLVALSLGACGRFLPSQHQTVDPASLPTGNFTLDRSHASLLWKIDHFGFSTYVGRFNRFDAELAFDPDDPAASSLLVTIETASVDTGNPEFDEELGGVDWLKSEAYPQASFVSRQIEITGPNTGILSGTLELAGHSGEVDLDITFNGGADNLVSGQYTLGFAATATFSRSAFGIDYLVPAIGDEISLEIHAEFVQITPG